MCIRVDLKGTIIYFLKLYFLSIQLNHNRSQGCYVNMYLQTSTYLSNLQGSLIAENLYVFFGLHGHCFDVFLQRSNGVKFGVLSKFFA